MVFGHLAQLVEQLTLNQRVIGSSPIVPTISCLFLIFWKVNNIAIGVEGVLFERIIMSQNIV